MIKGVYIEPECLTTLITSAIEVYNRETNGFLLGRIAERRIRKRNLKVLVLEAASPFQLEERKPTSVSHANKKAVDRLVRSLNTMKRGLVGGYHSHPFPHDLAVLSRDDIEFIGMEIEHLKKYGFPVPQWLEVVMAIKMREYKTGHRTGVKTFRLNDSVGLVIKNTPHRGFAIKMRAYILVKEDGKMRREVAKIYLPRKRRVWQTRS